MRQNTDIASLIPFYRLLIISTSVAIIAVLSYFILPDRSIRLLPDNAQNHFLFYDGQNGGKTQAVWVDEKRFSFKCIGNSNGNIQWPYCGLKANLGEANHGLDLSSYQRMHVNLRYQGNNKRLRFFMSNFNPAYADPSDVETFKPLFFEILSNELTENIVIQKHEWQASVIWVADRRIPRHLSYPEFTNIVHFGVDLVSPIADGKHILEIDYIELRGPLVAPEKWYLCVALTWLATTLLFIARYLLRLQRRIHNDESRLSSLANYSHELKQESEKYKELSCVDSLTGALNRHGLASHMSIIASDGSLPLNTSLLILDIDHFKKVNDTKGHDVGDQVLRQVAKYIQTNIRSVDHLVRWGGEEFVVFLMNTRASEALNVAEKLRLGVECLQIQQGEDTIPITISIGVGTANDKENFDELFHSTDQALYTAKNSGRNRVVIMEN